MSVAPTLVFAAGRRVIDMNGRFRWSHMRGHAAVAIAVELLVILIKLALGPPAV
jgi:hypothetical protein